jgi:hypothetical protein
VRDIVISDPGSLAAHTVEQVPDLLFGDDEPHKKSMAKEASSMAGHLFANAALYLTGDRPTFSAHFGLISDGAEIHRLAATKLVELLALIDNSPPKLLVTVQKSIRHEGIASFYENVTEIITSIGSRAIAATSSYVGEEQIMTDIRYASVIFPLTEQQLSRLTD